VLADGTDAGLDAEGELVLDGPQKFLGYIDPQLDAHAYVDGTWFRTGDLGVVQSDGNVRITGRLKDIIIRNAENISALEVEEVAVHASRRGRRGRGGRSRPPHRRARVRLRRAA